MDRREFIMSFAGVAAAAVLPTTVAQAAPLINVIKTPQEVITHRIMTETGLDGGQLRFVLGLNLRFIQALPELFQDVSQLATVSEAKTRMLKTVYSMEMAQDGIPSDKAQDLEWAIADLMVAEAVADYRAEMALYVPHKMVMKPYIPMLPSGVRINDSLMLEIQFFTRYGIGPTA